MDISASCELMNLDILNYSFHLAGYETTRGVFSTRRSDNGTWKCGRSTLFHLSRCAGMFLDSRFTGGSNLVGSVSCFLFLLVIACPIRDINQFKRV